MHNFFTNCATVLQEYGFSYLRGAGTTLLLALVGTALGCLIGFLPIACRTPSGGTVSALPVWQACTAKLPNSRAQVAKARAGSPR